MYNREMFIQIMIYLFGISIAVMLALLILRYIEVSWRTAFISKLFRNTDLFVQKKVSQVSIFVLLISSKVKYFVLVHFFHMSSEALKNFLKETTQRREVLLMKLRGSGPKSSEERVEDDVSPYLREISRIDRKEE